MHASTPTPASAPSPSASAHPTAQSLVLGGGCFWCTEAAYELVPGALDVVSGFAGGTTPNPTYEQVISGRTGHAEVIRITFDPSQVSLDTLLDFFWEIHDPTTLNRQGNDVGTHYRSLILYADPAQKTAAEASLARANPQWNNRIVTQIVPLEKFYEAEAYHQDYFRRNPEAGYCQIVIRPKIEKLRRSPTVRGSG